MIRKTISVFLVLMLFLALPFAFAEEADGTGSGDGSGNPDEGTGDGSDQNESDDDSDDDLEDQIEDLEDELEDALDDLDDDLEEELDDYENETFEDDEDLLEELEEEFEESLEEAAEDLGVSIEELLGYEEAANTIGPKQYVLNMQFRHRVKVAMITGNAIMKHLEKKGEDVSDLQAILDQISDIESGLNASTMTKEEYDAGVQQIRNLTQEFKALASSRVSKDDVEDEIEQALEEASEELEELNEDKIRKLYNRGQANNQMKKLVQDAKQMNNNNEKLLMLKQRLQETKELRNRYLSGNATKEDVSALHEEWKEQLRLYQEEKLEAKIGNERADLLQDAKEIRQAINDAKQNGEDTTELESQLDAVMDEVRSMNSNQIRTEAEIRAKAQIAQNRLDNIKQAEKIKARLNATRPAAPNAGGQDAQRPQPQQGRPLQAVQAPNAENGGGRQ